MNNSSERQPVRTGVIGAGFIGPAHIESLRRLGFVDLAAVADISQAAAERAAAALHVPKAYGDFMELVQDAEIDVVDVCVPNNLHYVVTKAALDAGKHVVSEKPLGMSSAESAELLQLARERGVVHAVIFNQRYYPLLHHARALIREGKLGTIYNIHGGFWQDWLLKATDYNWRVESSQGGRMRAVGDIGSHWLDLAEFVTGHRVTHVLGDFATFLPVREKPAAAIETFSTAVVARVTVPVDTEDAASVLLRFEGNAHGLMQVCQVSPGRKNHLTLEVNGSEASIAWDAEQANQLWIGHRDRANEVLIKDPALMHPSAAAVARYPSGHAEGFPDTHTAIQRAIYEFIRGGGYESGLQPTFPTFVDGHRENVICDSIWLSAHQEAWVTVPRTELQTADDVAQTDEWRKERTNVLADIQGAC